MMPVVFVYGPPAAGKTTYVAARTQPGDVVVDLDDICHAVTGTTYRDRATIHDDLALQLRDAAVEYVLTRPRGAWQERTAWIIALRPNGAHIDRARRKHPVEVERVMVPLHTCMQRIGERGGSVYAVEQQRAAVERWFAQEASIIGLGK